MAAHWQHWTTYAPVISILWHQTAGSVSSAATQRDDNCSEQHSQRWFGRTRRTWRSIMSRPRIGLVWDMGPSFYSVMELSVATSFPLTCRSYAAPSSERLHTQGLAAGTEKRQLSDKKMTCRLFTTDAAVLSTSLPPSQRHSSLTQRLLTVPQTPLPDRHPKLICAQLLNKSPVFTQLENSLPCTAVRHCTLTSATWIHYKMPVPTISLISVLYCHLPHVRLYTPQNLILCSNLFRLPLQYSISRSVRRLFHSNSKLPTNTSYEFN